MGWLKKSLCLVLIFLLLVPASGFAQERSDSRKEIISTFQQSSGPKKQHKEEKTQSTNPADYPLIQEGEIVGWLLDSKNVYHEITFERIYDMNDSMDIEILYNSDKNIEKDSYIGIEFYKDIGGTLKFLGYVEYDTYGVYEAYLIAQLLKSIYSDQPYIYLRIGVFPDKESEYYSDVTTFKVRNPFYSETAPEGNKYVLISNESVDVNNTQDTGAFKINNDQYTINKKIGLNAYKLDVIRPFDTEKHEDKKLQQKSLSKKFLNKVGDTKTFWVHDFTTNEDKQISTKLLYSGTKTNVWVYDNQITEADAQKLGQEFDQKIYPLITQNFASESDVDGNGKIHILCYDIQDGFAGFGGYIAGYFYGGDLHDIPYSNKSEIFYIDTYPLMGTGTEKDVSAAYETLAHEFQHMVNFNQNVFIENGSQMDTWLDEALSMAAEHMYTGKPLMNTINYYNISTSITNGHSLLYWDDNGDTLSNYSLSYLFGQYVRIQANQGNKIFKEILTDTHNDYKAVENVAKKYIDPTLTFGKLMTNFRAALLLKKDTGIYGFNGEEGFDSLIPKIFSGESASLRGGGAIVKRAVGNETVPASKGDDITYTFFDVEENKPSTPPSKPIVNPVSDRDTFINGLSDPGTTVYVQLGSKILNSAAADNNGSFRISISKQKAGTVLSVYARDQAGNKSESVQITVLDKTPPSIPSVNLVSDKDKTVRGTAEAGSKITIKAGSKVLSTGTTDKNGKFTISLKTAQKAGTVLYVTATDKAGNVSPARKVTVIDKTPPRTPSVNSVSNKDKTVRGTAEAGSKITIKAGSKVLSTGTTDKNGKFAISLKTAQKAGTILYVTATDKAGNVSPARKVTVLDKIPPGAPKVNKVTRKSSSVTGKAEAYSTVYVKAGKKVIGSGKANKNGNFSVSIKKQKAGTVLLVYAKDKAGNVGKSTKVTVKYK
ncbi:hypothetical protein APP_01690 [Aeribacillus pallidus]|nr:hypothetical protein APP_01690 [Aeribacillus pallidus]